jgi:ribose transport system permease protein
MPANLFFMRSAADRIFGRENDDFSMLGAGRHQASLVTMGAIMGGMDAWASKTVFFSGEASARHRVPLKSFGSDAYGKHRHWILRHLSRRAKSSGLTARTRWGSVSDVSLKVRGGRRKGSLLEYVVIGVILTVIPLFSVFIQGFATLGNLRVIASNSAALVILSCGMGMVIISRGLDLSLVATMVAGATTFAILIDAGYSGPVAMGLTLLVVAAIGFANGWLIAYVEIPAMLATLASAMVITGFFRFAVLRGEFLLLLPKTNPAVVFFSNDILPGLTAPVALMIATFVLTWILLRYTTLGRITYAMGDNFQAARLTGLPVRITTLMIYIYAALTALLAGLVTSASSGTVDFRTVTNGSLLFEVILVVVLGGIPLRGGRGGMRNILVGAALIAVLRNGMTLFDLTTQTQDVLKGLVLIIAIVTDNYFNPRDTETDTVGDL